MDIAFLEKNLQRNEVEVRALFHQTGELKMMKIRNFKNQNSTKKWKKISFKIFKNKFSHIQMNVPRVNQDVHVHKKALFIQEDNETNFRK